MKRTLRRQFFYISNVFIPLVFGLLLYLIFQKDAFVSIVVNFLFPSLSLPAIDIPVIFERILRNYAADALWSYSLTFAFVFVIGYERKRLHISAIVCFTFEIFMEYLQRIEVLNGTFDFFDILVELISTCVATILIYMYEEEQNEKSSKGN